jgi:hypothetical protein
MDRKDAITWVLSLCALTLRRSQAKTLSELVAGAVGMVRASLAELGRCVSAQGPVDVKHCIKRVDRFVGNGRIEPAEAMRGAVQWLARPRKRLLVSIDWVELRQLHCLVLAARLRGRALPLLWAVYRDEELFRSQNNLEYGLLRLLRTMVPSQTQVVILGDRGFGRTEMARECQKLGFDYILRIRPDVYVRHPSFTGKLLDLPLRRGTQRMLRNVAYRKERSVTQHVGVLWAADRNEPWFLATNLPRLGAQTLSRIYGRRMTIEEYFRDTKSKRNGFALRLTLIRCPKRVERMLLVLALAYWLLVAVGLAASQRFGSGAWCSNTRPGECSLFTIGRVMFARLHLRARPVLHALRTEVLKGNWG